MALTDKNILITPNIGSSVDDPKIVFSGADASTGPQNITLKAYPTNNGTLSFEGSAGQLFSITNSMTGTIYSVNDVSGIPSIEVLDTGLIKLAQYSGNVLIGTSTDDGVNKLQVAGNISVTGTVDGRDLSVDGAKLDGIAAGAEVNQNAFSNVVVSGQTTVAADSKTDTLTLIAGTNVTITTDANTDSITISSTDTNTTYSAGNGLTLTGTTFAVGTPSTLTTSTTNSTTTTSHTHAVTFPVTSVNAKTGGVTLTSTDVGAIPTTEKGVANGVATLDSSGLIPSSQLPSYVDDVLEFTNLASFPSTGESGKIYIALDTNKTYRWSGSAYVYITSGAVDSVNAGNAITVSSTTGVVTVNHADTSSQASVNNSGNTFIQDITLDTYGHITGIASATVAIGNGTLTVNTSGTGLSGSGTFTANQSTNNTITITSNATSANTASTVVARDASGNFSAGTITATLSGTATQVSNTLTRGTYLTGNNFNGSAATTWAVDATSDNTASKVVARDANGDFAARIVTVTDLNSTSDASLKDNVQVVDGLAKLEQVNPVEFIWKQSGNKSYGVIAQELEKIMPELVAEQDNGIKNVSYIPLIALLIDAVKKLDARVKELAYKSVASVDLPLSSSSDGMKGQISVDSEYLYVCVGSNMWKRIPLQDWT